MNRIYSKIQSCWWKSSNSSSVIYYQRYNFRTSALSQQEREDVDVESSKTYQRVVFKHLSNTFYWKRTVKKLYANDRKWKREWQNTDTLLKNLPNHCKSEDQLLQKVDKELHHVLPTYLFCMNGRNVHREIINLCDLYCFEIYKSTFDNDSLQKHFTAMQVLHGWLNVFYPHIHRIRDLNCFGKLIHARGREVFSLWIKSKDLPDALIHLAYFAGLGKTTSFECQEILNQMANFCDQHFEITYKLLSPFELGILCESFFKAGVGIQLKNSPKVLSHISDTICQLLSQSLKKEENSLPNSGGTTAQDFNPFVITSLLKILRQVNYIEDRLLTLLGELIHSPRHEENTRNIGFIMNIIPAFIGPGRNSSISSKSTSEDHKGDISSSQRLVKILNRMESLVVRTIQDEQMEKEKKDQIIMEVSTTMPTNPRRTRNPSLVLLEQEVDSGMKSRLKDISHWLYITATVGYQMNTEIYQKSLSFRIHGEFIRRPSDAVDALLALAIMNHYPDGEMLEKILHSSRFRDAISAKCSKRHKGRFGLFLTSLDIEHSLVWAQLSPDEQRLWFDALGTAVIQSPTWSPHPIRVKAIESFGISKEIKPQTQLLNECMDAIKAIFCGLPATPEENKDNQGNDNYSNKIVIDSSQNGKRSDSNPGQLTENSKIEVLVGYSVPFLFIPGIKLSLHDNTRQEIFIEVLDSFGISQSYHNYKLRLMKALNYETVVVTREELESQSDLKVFFNNLINRLM